MSEFNWNPLHNLPCTSYLPAYRRQGTLYIVHYTFCLKPQTSTSLGLRAIASLEQGSSLIHAHR